MKKRGQLTLFVITTVIIIATIIAYFIFSNQSESDLNVNFLTGKGLSTELETTRANLFDCIDITTEEALLIVELQGGFISKPEKYYDMQVGFYPYYYYEGEYYMPTQEQIEHTISNYINNNLQECINAKDFPIQIELSPIQTTTQIKDSEVIFNLDTTLTISQNETVNTIKLKEKEFTQNSKIKGMIEIAQYLTEYHKTDPKYYCINCVGLMAYERELNVDIFPFIENNTFQVIIHDDQTNSSIRPMFIYLNKYTGEEVSPLFN